MTDRKFLVTALVRCKQCLLLYRSPTTPKAASRHFYQKAYKQGFTTDMPEEHALREMLSSQFQGTPKHFGYYIQVIHAVGVREGAKVLDYGCSWGYGSWQLARAGFDVCAYEISSPRCRYARERLGVKATENREEIAGLFDIAFSSHVLEHVDQVEDAFEFLTRRLKPSGFMVHFTPNGSMQFRAAQPGRWHKLWGYVHPQLLDEMFCQKRFSAQPYFLASTGFGLRELAAWDQKTQVTSNLENGEFLIVVRNQPLASGVEA